MDRVELLLVGVLLSVLPGCLTRQYEISKDELDRLAQLDPAERGRRVRVVQQTGWDSDEVGHAPPADAYYDHDPCCAHRLHIDVHGHYVGGSRSGRGRNLAGRPRATGMSPSSVRAGPGTRRVVATRSAGRGPAGRTPAAPRPTPAVSGGSRVPATPTARSGAARTPARPTASASSGRASSRGSSGSGSSVARGVGKAASSGGGDGDAAAALAVVGLVVAAGAMTVVAPTEGGRYDGWMQLHPDHPVLVVPERGSEYWVPLGSLNASMARRAERAVIVDDGAAAKLGRAPLDRRGFAFSLEAGAAAANTRHGLGDPAFQARLGLGAFVTRELGLLVGAQFATLDQDGTVFNGRMFLEGQGFPLEVGRFHFGGFGEGGYAWALHDAPGYTQRASDPYVAGGALAQIDITTRLAFTLRVGAAWLPTIPAEGERLQDVRLLVPEGSLGLAVY